ncbi:ABC transporter permease [Lutimaribacter sp. EGI FJ00015]|uniref:ABC transporter permease n=1 Tax=Lutimaribacter degradans TaxID=2945989 RepID=A0ACC5ZT09_9RHOB|nr:ABC transporter permease [Lutimaribacter sp. EGI FJ00013]MCM2561313.1 ABC transporter permease [Lutimaribacter sp. EGI FJ00013]MCO0611736.1 ABC transporter permease [Lutimaribacter sp. EGI FJ00015]MCO0635142.1 ABC transporter permease [Lutimaribacter sp. EGI FJ00014]
MTDQTNTAPGPAHPTALTKVREVVFSSPIALIATVLVTIIVLAAIFAPVVSPHDPVRLTPSERLKPPSELYWLGTDAYGRDLVSRIIYGGRISLVVGVGAAVFAVLSGLFLGLMAGYIRWLDAVLMRMVDGLMAIPNILLAIAIVSLWGAGLWTVLIAITIPEVPRVVRLVRSVVLSAREEPYVEAAIAAGSSTFLIMRRHLLPNTIAPLIIQGTYICASAILVEAILSFLGAGINPETPSWGNIMAEGRIYFQINPGIVLWPGLVVSVTILAINLLGDAVRDALDPRMAKRGIDR